MAGHGPPPKDPSKRARANKEPIPLRVIEADPVEQPELPTFEIEVSGELVEFTWPARTREWWQMWADSPLSAEFTSTDWSELLDTAVLSGFGCDMTTCSICFPTPRNSTGNKPMLHS